MQNHARRSLAGSPPPRWTRPDVPRPGPRELPDGVADLDPPDDPLGLLEPSEAPVSADLLDMLSQAARRDFRASLDEVAR